MHSRSNPNRDLDRIIQSKITAFLSPKERRVYQNKLYESSMRILNEQCPELYSKQRLHLVVNSIESSAFKSATTKEEYHQQLLNKFNIFKVKISQQLQENEENPSEKVRQDISLNLESSDDVNIKRDCSSSTSVDGDQLVSIKLHNLQRYLPSLLEIITRCEQQLCVGGLTEEKQAFLRSSLPKLNLIRSILEGKDFAVPKDSTRLETLEKVEQQLEALVSRLSHQDSSSSSDGENDEDLDDEDVASIITINSFLEKLDLQKYSQVFIDNCITSVEDIRALSEEDFRELQIPIGARNRIKAYFLQLKETISHNFSISEGSSEEQVIQLREEFCNQLWEHFKCPITQDLMMDPVVSSDGYTYEREAISQWLKMSNKSPLTGLVLSDLSLRPNHSLRSQITQFCGTFEAQMISNDTR